MNPSDVDQINAQFEYEGELREKIREQVNELEKKTRLVAGTLNRIHSTPSDQLTALVALARPTLESCGSIFSKLAAQVPQNQFWKWKDLWSKQIQSCIFVAALCEYLEHNRLLPLERASAIFRIDEAWKDRFHISSEDYLHGIISLVNELSRLAVNAVTLGNFNEPFKISSFIKDVFAGFSLLNLKNDMLRRRFDSLKYDVKKVEEVVYDVSLRRLAHTSEPPS